MTKIEWINLIGLAAAVAAGAYYVGHLSGRVDAMDPDESIRRIKETEDEALKKLEAAVGGFSDPANLHSEEFSWTQGQPPVQMIRVNEGICYLAFIRGKFEGTGESVSIDSRGDFWFLGGTSQQAGVAARARCWEFPTLSAD